jgi:hypothetical protein
VRVEEKGDFIAQRLRNVREEEEGVFLAQTLRNVWEEKGDFIAHTLR